MTKEKLPEYLKQGEVARLFPVLSTTSKEGRTTSIVLACMSKVEEFGANLLGTVGQRIGKRSKLETFTEVVFEKTTSNIKDRPDGLIVLSVGGRQWRALVEAKIGSSELDADQLERYRNLAKENGVDCVISISNQFATTPENHPLEEIRKSRSKIPVFHWSWMHILTAADLLVSGGDVADVDQLILLNELRRFLTHESAGVKGFERMPKEWSELNKLVSSGGSIPTKSALAQPVIEAWHQETRDLTLILSRMTGAAVSQKLAKKHTKDPVQRTKDNLVELRELERLSCTIDIPDAAAPVDVIADIKRRSVDVGMTLRAPEDKVSTKARLNWLLRQIKVENSDRYFVRLMWPGKSEDTQFSVSELRADADCASEGKEHLAPHGFHVFLSERLGSKFTQQTNFISELERLVPEFYRDLGSIVVGWQKKAPKVHSERATGSDVATDAIAEEAEDFDG